MGVAGFTPRLARRKRAATRTDEAPPVAVSTSPPTSERAIDRAVAVAVGLWLWLWLWLATWQGEARARTHTPTRPATSYSSPARTWWLAALPFRASLDSRALPPT